MINIISTWYFVNMGKHCVGDYNIIIIILIRATLSLFTQLNCCTVPCSVFDSPRVCLCVALLIL